MPISPARIAAFDILMRVEQEQAFASELLHSPKLDRLSTEDRALTTEIVMGVLRWQSQLDSILAQHASRPLNRLDHEVSTALRIGAYQLLHLDRIPRYSAVDDSVNLVKRAKKTSAAGFANAVLRKIQPRAEKPTLDSPGHIAQSYAHPQWLVERWTEFFGIETAFKICAADQEPPTRTTHLSDESAEADLKNEGMQLAPGAFLRSARRVVAGDVTRTSGFRAGRVAIQDEASQLIAYLAGKGNRILDCCAAPGGKTAILAQRNPEAHITATELHEHRVRMLRDRLKHSGVEVIRADALNYSNESRFDRVLADVPCSGTGTLGRNPEIKWRLKPENLQEHHQRQVGILHAALNHLAPGGELLYSTCSLEKEEDEDVVAEILATRSEVRIANLAAKLEVLRSQGDLVLADFSSLLRGQYLRTVPGIHHCDGFFAALLQKPG